MVGLIVAIVVFNILAFKTNKRLNKSHIAHIWTFTIALQSTFDTYIDLKYQGYWYFTKGVDWASLPANIALVPPVNMMFINWYPFKGSFVKKLVYFICWEVTLLIYEVIAMLPKPWGYFSYGWWGLGYSTILNPLLLIILVFYYQNFINEKT